METTIKKKAAKKISHENGHAVNGSAQSTDRLSVNKTYKLYIDGKFPRTESGRYYQLKDKNGAVLANICRSSRKDLRDSIVSNRKAQPEWAKRTAYNKGQILYRIAETLEGRKAQFVDTMIRQGYTSASAQSEVNEAIDLLVYYAGWTDKYIQVFSSVNPVESSHFNFSYPEPTGVVTIFPSENSPLVSLVASVAPVIAGGNVCTIMAAEKFPLTAIEFAEVLHASDLPGGVINLLTGNRKEIIGHASSHMDVNALIYNDLSAEHLITVQTNAALNVKRIVNYSKEEVRSPYRIMSCQEIKTTWHPVGI
jgi:acyl-CoA reductase-like NAD-dependent aldehyde dehydrogenase